jgi:hypothetical protein
MSESIRQGTVREAKQGGGLLLRAAFREHG